MTAVPTIMSIPYCSPDYKSSLLQYWLIWFFVKAVLTTEFSLSSFLQCWLIWVSITAVLITDSSLHYCCADKWSLTTAVLTYVSSLLQCLLMITITVFATDPSLLQCWLMIPNYSSTCYWVFTTAVLPNDPCTAVLAPESSLLQCWLMVPVQQCLLVMSLHYCSAD
jgi:hypothetical protein